MILREYYCSLTLLIITNEAGFPKAGILIEDGDVVPNVNLTSLINNKGVKRANGGEGPADMWV